MKRCSKCGKTKAKSKFVKSKQTKDGCHAWCKECNRESHKKYRQIHKTRINKQKKEQRKTPEGKKKMRKVHLRSKYGMTVDEHQLMYILQNGKCAICKRPTAYSDIKTDHDHKTDKVRGLLCNRCNVWMAAIDNEVFMKIAIEYAKRGIV